MKKVIAYIHSHWDREWYREFEEFRLRLIEVFDEVLDNLKTNELPFFYFDGQTAALEDYLEIYPEKTEEIKSFIKQKKLRVGPFYCSADSFLVSGESLYRNLELGIQKSKELGESEFIAYLSDTFGHSQAMVYILKAFNIDKACMWRGLGDLPADINWNGINVTYLIQGYFQDFLNVDSTIDEKTKLVKNYINKIALKSSEYVLLPVGADHLKVADKVARQINVLNYIYNDYKIKVGTPFDYFEKIKERQYVTGEFLDNSRNFILPGVYSSRIYIKQANAKSQWLLTNIAEPLQAVGHFFFNTKNKQREINHAYKILIKNHAHDSIYGCCIDKVCKEIMTRFEKTDSISNGIIKRTIRDLNNGGKNLSVINIGNYEYNGKINIVTNKKLPKWMNAVKINSKKGFTDEKLYNINEIPVTEDITNLNEYIIDVKKLKPFSITQITQDNICNEETLTAISCSIENKNIKIEVKDGKINITDKKTQEKYADFITITNRADIGDSYNFGALQNDKPLKADLLSCESEEINRQRAVLTMVYKINIPEISTAKGRSSKCLTHKIKIQAILYNQSEYIEFKTSWVNKSKNHILQIGFNLKNKITSTLNEDLYGITERKFNPEFDIYKELPVNKKGIELKPNTSPMQRFMSTQNFGLMTKGNCEYEVYKNTVNLTLLRATGIISEKNNPTRTTPAGPPLNTPDLQCPGENNADFAVCFTNKVHELYAAADIFYGYVLPLFTNIRDNEFIKITNQNIRVTSIQNTENGINIRLFNNSDQNEETEIITSKKIKCKFKAKEIKNIAIEH